MRVTQPFQALREHPVFVKVFLVSHDPTTGSGELMRQGLSGHNDIRRFCLFQIKTLGFVTVANR